MEDPPRKFFRLTVGREVRLRYAYLITCTEVVKDPETVSIVEAILTMATKLGLCVVAEGVESQHEYDFLRKRGCHYFQGYMFGEPVSESHLIEFLQDQTKRIGAGDGMQSTFEGF